MRLRPAGKAAEAVLVPLPEDILLVTQSRTCDRGLDGFEFDPRREENLEINYAILPLPTPNVPHRIDRWGGGRELSCKSLRFPQRVRHNRKSWGNGDHLCSSGKHLRCDYYRLEQAKTDQYGMETSSG
jgi:hypothetical protein